MLITPVLWKYRQEDSRGFLASQPRITNDPLVSKIDTVSNTRWTALEKQHLRLTSGLYIYVNKTHVHTHTCIHTQSELWAAIFLESGSFQAQRSRVQGYCKLGSGQQRSVYC